MVSKEIARYQEQPGLELDDYELEALRALSPEEILQLVLIDPLTGLGNKRRFKGTLERFGHKRELEYVTLILFDLDHFKQINDTYGHSVGDAVLTEAAATINGLVRRSERPFRIGGEEFAILMNHHRDSTSLAEQLDEGIKAAERIREAVSERRFSGLPEGKMVTISGGVASAMNDASLDNLYKNADKALYAAKGAGRNCVRSMPC